MWPVYKIESLACLRWRTNPLISCIIMFSRVLKEAHLRAMLNTASDNQGFVYLGWLWFRKKIEPSPVNSIRQKICCSFEISNGTAETVQWQPLDLQQAFSSEIQFSQSLVKCGEQGVNVEFNGSWMSFIFHVAKPQNSLNLFCLWYLSVKA